MAHLNFIGSGTSFLDRVYGPVEDDFDYDDDEGSFDEEIFEDGEEVPFTTLADVGFSITPNGGIVLHVKDEDSGVVFKKSKLPKGLSVQKVAANECGICLMAMDDDDGAEDELVSTSCGHHYCRQCLAFYLHLESGDISTLKHTLSFLETTATGSHHLRIREVFGVRCPHPTCHHIIETDEFRSLVDNHTWERFNDLTSSLFVAALRRSNELAPCTKKGCGGFLQNCICTSALCRLKEGRLAEKRQKILHKRWLLAEKHGMELLRIWSAHVARQCPKCNMLIEKNGGCDHMYCIGCKTRYNWSESSGLKPTSDTKAARAKLRLQVR